MGFESLGFLLCQLVEVGQTDGLHVELHHLLQGLHQLHVDGAIHIAFDILALLQLLIGILVEHIIGHVAHTILGKLLAHGTTCHLLQVVVFHLDVIVIRKEKENARS